MKKRVLITGINGFTGGHLAQLLFKKAGYYIIGSGRRNNPRCPELMDEYLTCDLQNPKSIFHLIELTFPDFIYHLAGVNTTDPQKAISINTLGTIHLLDAVQCQSPSSKILVIGSAAEYGTISSQNMPLTELHACNPTHPYGISKYAVTKLALNYHRQKKLRVTIARPFNIIGSGVPPSLVAGALIHRIRKAIENGNYSIPVGNLFPKRDFIDVRDVVRAYLQMLEGNFEGELFNLSSGKAIAIKEIANMIIYSSKMPINLREDPDLIRPSEVETFFGSSEKAKRLFGFQPVFSLNQSIQSAWDSICKCSSS